MNAIRRAIASGVVRRLRARWVALPDAPSPLIRAAESGGQLTCVSAGRHRGWWVPPGASDIVHVHLSPRSASPTVKVVAHWSHPIAPPRPREILASVEDSLAHAARCFPLDQAVAIWESAARVERLTIESLGRVRWRDAVAKRCLEHLRPGTDSSLETIFHVRLSSWGIRMRMQVQLAGHTVDFLIGTHLVVQIDGWSYHSSASDRSRDIAHDAALRMRGYTVLRFSYDQVINGWPHVEQTLAAAVSRGLHLEPAS